MLNLLSDKSKKLIKTVVSEKTQSIMLSAQSKELLSQAVILLKAEYSKANSAELIDINVPDESSKTSTLTIAEIRLLRTVSASIKKDVISIYVLHNFQTATVEAQNAFLKVLEEPSKSAIFVLLTDSDDKLLDTIKSRVQIYEIDSIQKTEVIKTISSNGDIQDSELLNRIYMAFGGSLDVVIKSANNEAYRGEVLEIITDAKDFLSGGIDTRLKITEKYYKDSNKAVLLLDVLRSILSLKINKIDASITAKSINKIDQSIKVIAETKEALNSNGNIKIILDNLSLRA